MSLKSGNALCLGGAAMGAADGLFCTACVLCAAPATQPTIKDGSVLCNSSITHSVILRVMSASCSSTGWILVLVQQRNNGLTAGYVIPLLPGLNLVPCVPPGGFVRIEAGRNAPFAQRSALFSPQVRP